MILALGKCPPSFLHYFRNNSIPYFYLKDTSQDEWTDEHTIEVNFRDSNAFEQAFASLPQSPDCIFTIYERYIPLAAKLNEKLGLKGITTESALICTDKFLMRSKLKDAPEKISPDFSLVSSQEDLLNFANSHKFPLMLKPTSLSKSLLIHQCNSLPELMRSYDEASKKIHELYSNFTLNKTPQFIVEEFLHGTMHTVMTFSDKNGKTEALPHIVDITTAKEVGYDDSFLFARRTPSALSSDSQKQIREAAIMAVQTLGLRSCPGHVEIMLTTDGPMIIEVGARIGGYRTLMYEYSTCRDIIGAVLDCYKGKMPSLLSDDLKQNSCAIIELFPHDEGLLESITNKEQIKSLKSLHNFSTAKPMGSPVGRASQGYKAVATITLLHTSTKQIEDDISYITQFVSVLTKPQHLKMHR